MDFWGKYNPRKQTSFFVSMIFSDLVIGFIPNIRCILSVYFPPSLLFAHIIPPKTLSTRSIPLGEPFAICPSISIQSIAVLMFQCHGSSPSRSPCMRLASVVKSSAAYTPVGKLPIFPMRILSHNEHINRAQILERRQSRSIK